VQSLFVWNWALQEHTLLDRGKFVFKLWTNILVEQDPGPHPYSLLLSQNKVITQAQLSFGPWWSIGKWRQKARGFLTTSLDLVEHAEHFLSSRNTFSEFITSKFQEYNLSYKYRASNKFWNVPTEILFSFFGLWNDGQSPKTPYRINFNTVKLSRLRSKLCIEDITVEKNITSERRVY
jgi:hypothetical protein